MDVIFGLLSLFLVFFLVIKNLNKYFVPTPAEGRERVNHSHFQWILSVPGGGVKLRFQQQAQTLHAAISERILSTHSKLTETHEKTTETHEYCGMFINLFYYLFIFASYCLSIHIIS